MPLIFNCTGCGTPLTIARRHRGAHVPCPKCAAEVDVPREIAFSALARDAALDHRRGNRLLAAAWISSLLWFPVIPALALFFVLRHIRAANDDGRPVVGPLHAARIVAVTALLAQCLYFMVAIMGFPTFVSLRFIGN